MSKICKVCQTNFEGSKNSQFCPSCAKSKAAARTAEWTKTNRRKGISVLICQRCSVEFQARRNDAKYCSDCGELVRKEQISAWGKGRRRGRKEPKTIICINCRQPYQATRSDATICGTCWPKVKRQRRNEKAARKCIDCGVAVNWDSTRCQVCQGKTFGGPGSVNFKGGRTFKNGYWHVLVGPKKYRLEHRVVYETTYGPIPKGHHVHHLDGDKTNNDPKNLVAMPHAEHHKAPREAIKPYEDRIRELEAKVQELTSIQHA